MSRGLGWALVVIFLVQLNIHVSCVEFSRD